MKEGMIEKYKKLQENESLVRLLVLYCIGIGLNIVFILAIPNLAPTAKDGSLNSIIPSFFALYFLIGIIFSTGATLSFSPKHIVSQLYIQILTSIIIVIGMSMFYFTLELAPVLGEIPKQESIMLLIMIPLFLGFTGFVQTEIIKKMVGLNGTENQLNIQSYEINLPCDEVASIIKQKSFLNLCNFNAKKTKDGMYVFSSRLRPITEKIILVLGPHNEKSILSTVSYDVKYHSIIQSNNANVRCNSIVSTLKEILKNNNQSYECIVSTQENDVVLTVKKLALAPTMPKIFAIRNYPKHMLLAIVGIAALFGIMSYVRYSAKIIDDNIYFSAIVLIILAILFQFIPLIREEKQNKADMG